MPPAKIAFGAASAPGLEELAGAPPFALNVLQDPSGAIRSRPGIKVWADFPTTLPDANPVTGMYPFNGRLVYVTNSGSGIRKLWSCESSGLVTALSDDTAATQLPGSLRPVFANTKSRLVVAGGGAVMKWEPPNLLKALGGSPPAASHIAAIADRLVVNNYGPSGIASWSNPLETGNEDWSNAVGLGAGAAVVNSSPDALVAVHRVAGRLFFFGTESLEVWVPRAGSTPDDAFGQSAVVEVGTAAPHSPIKHTLGMAWLDERRQFRGGNGSGVPETISQPGLQRTLAQLGTVSDCWGARVRIDATELFVWTFPTDGRTFVTDLATKTWTEWTSWSSYGRTAWTPTSYVYWPDKNLHLVGLPSGQIAQLDMETFTELGNPLVIDVATGFEGHGSMVRKICKKVRLRFRRGLGAVDGGAFPAYVELSWRDDTGAWGQPRRVDLGLSGDDQPVIQFFSLGMYRQRQWRLTMSSGARFTLVDAIEDFEELEG